jgi:O-antigen ligase
VQLVSLPVAGDLPRSERRTARGITVVAALQVALLLFTTGNVGHIPILDLGDRQAPLLINDLSIAAVLALGGVMMLRARSMRIDDVSGAAMAFAAIGALSALASVQRFGFSTVETLGSLAYLARWMVYFCIYLVVINCVRARDTEVVWNALERAMLIIAVFGIFQAIFLPNFAFIVYPDARESLDFDSQRNRLVSTILEPNVASGMILIVLLVQLARLATGAREAWWKPAVMFAALVMTLSRGGMLAFVIGGIALLGMIGASKRLMRFAGFILVLMLAALPRLIEFGKQYARFGVSDASAMGRVIVWQRSLATLAENPWFGIGFNTYGFVQERRGFERIGGASYSAEGGLLFIAVMTGIVGLMVYLTMLWFVLRRTRRAWRDERATPAERGLLFGTAAATVAILVHSAFVNSLLTPWVMEPLWILWGLALVIASDLRSRQRTPTPA